ncbi:uncharacterized protein LOC103315050 [Tribolium castaneum]|uniref:Uncharacterized protein n=1 Tax=Tribolium castaneum TaxID=7070 RepID=D6WD14_TRICA|nr:PREDICTED: uncharacterized protein LOC103315050 [Tribolium castaneum]EEZ98815.1 hypothetical protein TcasGA2_TC004421 [Tribolium castaneum]|eukprot:XP_008200973.1 PREDICTED: uncharacterized protein LOC103315050 [Tribolium castaneum]
MGNEDTGECSQQGDNCEFGRPLKKAKYVWQVKGKYHLKASYQNKSEPSVDEDEEKRPCECAQHKASEERKCIDNFLAKSESFFDSDEEEEVSKNIDKSISNEIPITLVSPYPKNQDYFLRKWQARQIARGYIENTINSVLETWGSAPFDAEDFVENCDEDGHIEDEGILVAIQAHGLQSNLPKKENSLSELAENALEKIDTVRSQILRQELGLEPPPECNPTKDCESEDLSVEYNVVDILNSAILVAIEKKGLSSNND